MAKKIITLSTLLLLSAYSFAASTVYPNYNFLSQKRPSIQLTIENRSKHKAFITMKVQQNTCKPSGLLKCESSQNNKNQDATTSFVKQIRFSKPRFVLAAKQTRIIYMRWKGAFPDVPVNFSILAEDASPKDIFKTRKSTISSSGTSVQYDIKVQYPSFLFVLPNNSKFRPPEVSKQDNELILKNPGTSQTYLLAQQECTKSAGCLSFRNTLLPKQTVSLPITQPGKITINYLDMNSRLQSQYKTITLE